MQARYKLEFRVVDAPIHVNDAEPVEVLVAGKAAVVVGLDAGFAPRVIRAARAADFHAVDVGHHRHGTQVVLVPVFGFGLGAGGVDRGDTAAAVDVVAVARATTGNLMLE